MKQLLIFVIPLAILSSCSVKKQSSTSVGRTDDVYFTANDTRKKEVVELSYNSAPNENTDERRTEYYTSTYADRLRHFGSGACYIRPRVIVGPAVVAYNNGFGMTSGLYYISPVYGYGSGFNSPFSPYYGYTMPFYDPFFSYGWGNSWMNTYSPYSSYYNPYIYNSCMPYYGYNPYMGYYNLYNPYAYNPYLYNQRMYNSGSRNNSRAPSRPMVRRTGSSNHVPNSSTSSSSPQNSSSGGSSGGTWYNGRSNNRGSSGSSGSSSGTYRPSSSGSSGSSSGGSRNSGGSTSGGTRRR